MEKVILAILILFAVYFIARVCCKFAISDLFCREDSWRVAEMNCECGKHYIATYPTCCTHLECPKCHKMNKATFMVIK